MSIKKKFIVIILSITIISMVFLGGLIFSQARETLKKSTLAGLHAVAEFREGEVFLYLDKLKTRAVDFSSDGYIRKNLEIINMQDERKVMAEHRIDKHLVDNKQSLDETIKFIDVLNLKGVVVSSTVSGRIGADKSRELYVKKKIKKAYIKDLYRNEEGILDLEVAVPIKDSNQLDIIIGYLVNHYDASVLNDLMVGEMVLDFGAQTQIRGVGETGETYIVNQDKLMINESLFVEDATFRQKVDTFPVRRCIESNKEEKGMWEGYQGGSVVGASMCINIDDSRWTLISEQNASEAFAPINHLRNVSVIIAVIIVFFLFWVIIGLAKSISHPIVKLTEVSHKIANGDLTQQVQVTSNDEIGQLGRSFNAMVKDLEQFRNHLEKRTDELKRSNKELEHFAFIASHDLQEPLRKVIAFGELLENDYQEVLQGDGLDYLNRMKTAAFRMKILIEGLLQYSRISTKLNPFEDINLDDMIQEILSDLEICIQENNAKFDIGKLPALNADKLQIRQLLQNFIGNSLKYRKIDQDPKIAISGSVLKDGSVEIEVKDNGIGFDEKYTEKVFTLFQRLHARNEYEGTGIGLAICKRIVERHQGEIEAKSIEGVGSVFTVRLPQKKRKELYNDGAK